MSDKPRTIGEIAEILDRNEGFEELAQQLRAAEERALQEAANRVEGVMAMTFPLEWFDEPHHNKPRPDCIPCRIRAAILDKPEGK